MKLLPPSVLYQLEVGPILDAFLLVLALSAALLTLVALLWRGRIELNAPPEQQREAAEHA